MPKVLARSFSRSSRSRDWRVSSSSPWHAQAGAPPTKWANWGQAPSDPSCAQPGWAPDAASVSRHQQQDHTADPGVRRTRPLGARIPPRLRPQRALLRVLHAPPRSGAPAGYDNTVTIAEYRAKGRRRAHADAASERIILQVDHPQFNHDGGTVAFGPDGYLYISIGDGGGANDVGLGHVEDWYAQNAGGNGQDITHNLLGNILRIDVDHGSPYAIPRDNPFVGTDGLDEIWAYGFRNPYRFSFDMGGNHALLSQDAGQELWEEVDLVVRRGNYGWNVTEGTHCFDTDNSNVSPPTCPGVDPTTGEPLRDPVIEFANAGQTAGLAFVVVGGHVYRGTALPEFAGRYIYGGATASLLAPEGRLFVSTPQKSGLWTLQELLINGTDRLNYVVKGFGQDNAGEVHVTASKILGPTGTTGTVFKFVPPGHAVTGGE